MIDNNANTGCHEHIPCGRYTGPSDRPDPDNAFYADIRKRFLHDSARYLGADLADSKVLSLCLDKPAFAELTIGRVRTCNQ